MVRVKIKIKAKIKILGNLKKNNFPKILIKMKAISTVQKFVKEENFITFLDAPLIICKKYRINVN